MSLRDVLTQLGDGLRNLVINYQGQQRANDPNAWLNDVDPFLGSMYNQLASEAYKSGVYGESEEEILSTLKDIMQRGDYRSLQGFLGKYHLDNLSPNLSSWLTNMISKQQMDEQNVYTSSREDTALLRQAEQLANLGLGTSNVISMGGAGSASSAGESVDRIGGYSALQKQQQKFETKKLLTNQLSNMVTRLAGAGIGGGALFASRKAAAKIAGDTAKEVTKLRHRLNNPVADDKSLNDASFMDEYGSAADAMATDWDSLMSLLGGK